MILTQFSKCQSLVQSVYLYGVLCFYELNVPKKAMYLDDLREHRTFVP